MEKELLSILQQHCGERGDSEGAVETLERIIRERNSFEILRRNTSELLSATVWHLNNVKDGEPTTNMGIPNAVYEVVGKKLAQLPNDKIISESEALQIARKR